MNSQSPNQGDVNAYVAWLATVGNRSQNAQKGIGTPMAFSSIKEYVGYLSRLLLLLHPNITQPVTMSRESHLTMLATKRRLGAHKKRARPMTLDDLRRVLRTRTTDPWFDLVFSVVSILAFFGAFRLGAIMPHTRGAKRIMRVCDMEMVTIPGSVVVTAEMQKNNVFGVNTRRIAIKGSDEKLLCLPTVLIRLHEEMDRRKISRDTRIAELHPRIATFVQMCAIIHSRLPPIPDTLHQKGKFSGHSFRRGFTQTALAAGFSIFAIMLHGDWASPESVTDMYASGAILPSIPLASSPWLSASVVNHGQTQPPLIQSSNMEALINWRVTKHGDETQPQPQRHRQEEETFSVGNPFALFSEQIRVAAPQNHEQSARINKAREWEAKRPRKK